MSSNLRLEEIVTIANGISEWTKKPIDCGYSYSGTYTPNGSDKAVVVNTSVTRFWAPATWSGYRNDYVATLSFGDTTIVELTARQAKKVYFAAEKAIQHKIDEEANRKKREEAEMLRKVAEKKSEAIGELKQALSGDSTLGAKERRPFYRRFLK